MELFYYCYKAPKEDRDNHTYQYRDPIQYDAQGEGSLVESDVEEKEPLTYTELNDSLNDVEVDPEKLMPDLSPVKESAEPIEETEEPPVIIEPEFSVNLMKRQNSRKFKTPSFKWKKKKKVPENVAYERIPKDPSPSAPELTFSTEDPINLDENGQELDEKKISIDSLNTKLKEKDQELASTTSANEEEADNMRNDVQFHQDRLRDVEDLLNRYKSDNMMLQQRCELAERERSAMQHGNYVELEKVRGDYQDKIDELARLPERLRTAEARYNDAETSKLLLQDQVTDQNNTINQLNRKIDLLSEQIGKFKDKFHSVNEDNIELSNRSQNHERKLLEADQHNKNLMDLVNNKDEAVESQQVHRAYPTQSYGASTIDPARRGVITPRYTDYPPNPHSGRLSADQYDREKSLTSRARYAALIRGPMYACGSTSTFPPDSDDPRLLDSYLLSKLQFEEYLRSQTDLMQHMMEREKALSFKSDYRDCLSSNQSELIPQYAAPLRERMSSKYSDIGLGYERVETPASIASVKASSEMISTSKYFDKKLLESESLHELDHLADSVLLPEPGSSCIVPGIVSTEPPGPNEMLLGGVLSLPHAVTYTQCRFVNGNHHDDESDQSSSTNLISSKSKKGRFKWGSKSKTNSKTKRKESALAK